MANPAANTSLGANDTELLHLRRSFVRHLAADRRTPATRSAYSARAALVHDVGRVAVPVKVWQSPGR